MTPFPWVDAMRFGFGVMRLAPKDFWAMTPRELAHAIHALRGDATAPIARGAFADLMRRYPDTKETCDGR